MAARTLRERIRLFGRNSAAVKQWLQAQDLVFNWQSPEAWPAPAGSGLPLLIRQDRAYQRAAARFYREDYLEALEAFQAVAEDGANPWRGWARFAIGTHLCQGWFHRRFRSGCRAGLGTSRSNPG